MKLQDTSYNEADDEGGSMKLKWKVEKNGMECKRIGKKRRRVEGKKGSLIPQLWKQVGLTPNTSGVNIIFLHSVTVCIRSYFAWIFFRFSCLFHRRQSPITIQIYSTRFV